MIKFRLISLVVTLACIAVAAMAVVPDGYYNSLKGQKGKALKDSIHQLTSKHTQLDYGDLWQYFPETDCYAGTNQVWDMYSNNTRYFSSTLGNATSGMNKEHSVPNSWWGGAKNAAYKDLFHLFPVDQATNSARGNYPFGEVSGNCTFDNGLSKTGKPVSGQGGGGECVFEPADQYKGDFARVYFYMACCYQNLKWKYTYMFTNYSDSDWRSLNAWSIDLLLRWAREDPVSEKELVRNDAVQKYQKNRNPFVDHPELMEYIWGNKQGCEWQPAALSGDVNGDGFVDVADINLVVNMILCLSGETAIADVDNSGRVDVTDVNIILNYILN